MFEIDRRVLDLVVAHRVPALDAVATHLGDLDQTGAVKLLAFLGFAALVLLRRQWGAALVVGLSAIAAEGLSLLLKQVITEPRPARRLAIVHAYGWAMPSDHAAFSAAATVALVLAFDFGSTRRRRVAAFVMAGVTAAVGFLMVYAGVHWLSDVLVGWVLGAAVALMVHATWQALGSVEQRDQHGVDVGESLVGSGDVRR
jgi:undecaprenyl-diphosphatase